MADLNLSPVTTNLRMQKGFSCAQRIVPKNDDGTVFDCTSLTIASINFSFSGFASVKSTKTGNISDNDETGFTLNFPTVDVNAIYALGNINGFTAPYSVSITDGSDTGIACSGTLTVLPTLT
jgi:hypothetical protein